MLFFGTHSVKVDDKGRLKLPSLVKERLVERYKDATYIVTSLTGDSVVIWPQPEFERIDRSLAQMSEFSKVRVKFQNTVNRYGAEATLDEQGRMLIPAKLRESAGMKGEVTLFWQGNHLEVHNQAKYDAEADQNRLTAEDLEELAKVV